jgi:hypothetical protein
MTDPSGTCAKKDSEQGLYGMVQFSTAISPPPFLTRSLGIVEPKENRFDVVEEHHINEFHTALAESLVPSQPAFFLEQRYGWADVIVPSNTWLGPRSRHAAIRVEDEFHEKECDEFPEVLRWPPRNPEEAHWLPLIRAQQARDKNRNLLPRIDCNDFLLSRRARNFGSSDQALFMLRRFVSSLYAQRRVRIFASDLSHRMYNVWFPPGLMRAQENSDRAFALLPFVTRVRRPFQVRFRRTLALSVILVPVDLSEGSDAQGPRRMGDSEIAALVHGLEGGTTYVVKDANQAFDLLDSPLVPYIRELAGQKKWPTAAGIATEAVSKSLSGTLREWVELLFTAAGEPILREGENSRKKVAETQIADEILRSIRLCTVSSVLVMSEGLQPFDLQTSEIVQRYWWPSQAKVPLVPRPMESNLPAEVQNLLRAIALDDRLPIGAEHRIDDIDCGVASGVIFAIPQHQCVVTAFSMRSERFPDRSALNLFAWMSHLLVGAASARAMMSSLVLEAEHSREADAEQLAKTSYSLTLEMEEMFDLKIAWPEYEFLYHRLRQRLGLDATYRRMRDRLEQLSRHASVVSQHEEEHEQRDETTRIKALQWYAAALAVGILLVGVWQVNSVRTPNPSGRWAWLSMLTVAAVILFCAYRYIRFDRKAAKRRNLRHPE